MKNESEDVMKKVLFILLLCIVFILLMSSVALAADGTGVEGDGAPDFWAYIVQEAYILIPALYLIGMFAKKVPGIPDWTIPLIVLGFGIVGAVLIIGVTIYGFIQGILVAGVTVFTNQVFKQIYFKDTGSGAG